MSENARNRALDRIYAQLPSINCQRKCAAYCGVIPMTRAESDRIKRKVGRRIGFDSASGTCSLLTAHGTCSVYSVRPLICRIWGLVEKMRCDHGCEPERWLTDAEASELIAQAMAVGGNIALPVGGARLLRG